MLLVGQRMYSAKCLLGTTIQQVGHTPTPVKADWTRSSLLAFQLIRIFLGRAAHSRKRLDGEGMIVSRAAPPRSGTNDTPETEPRAGNPCENPQPARCFEASAALVLPTGDAWTAFFRP